MPIDWDSEVDDKKVEKKAGHPKVCKVYSSHKTTKEGKCKIFHRCRTANTPECVAKGGD